MRNRVMKPALVSVGVLVCAWTLHAQAPQTPRPGAGTPTPATAKPSPPAPNRDLSGVWMMRNPPGSNRGYTNFTFTDPKADPPAMTAWGLEKFKEAKDSNGGNYTLEETNDPVLRKCYPPGVPRVYFHPYPFEFVQTPKQTLLIYEYRPLAASHPYRRPSIAGRSRSALDGNLGRSLGGQHRLRRRDHWLQRENLARSAGPRAQRSAEGHRAVPSRRSRSPRARHHNDRPESAGKTLVDNVLLPAAAELGDGRNFLLGRLSGFSGTLRRGRCGADPLGRQVSPEGSRRRRAAGQHGRGCDRFAR